MSDRALSPSALVSFLLDLAKRDFDGRLTVGGRTIVLVAGEVVEIEPGEGDESVARFLVSAGRLKAEKAQSIESEAAGDPNRLVSLLSAAVGREEVVVAAQRATWLDRIVRAIEAAESQGDPLPRPVPGTPTPPSEGLRIDFAPLLLEALARRAGERDAGVVGSKASAHFVLTSRALPEVATRFAGFAIPAAPTPVFRLLAQTPSAAARIAALVRAGWGRIGTPDELSQLAAQDAEEEARPAPEVVEKRPTPPPLELTGTTLPDATRKLDDPIEPYERSLRELTERGAAPHEIASVWKQVARIWEYDLFAIEEAARAYREAAAIDPTDFESLAHASRLCRALGRHDLSRAYAEAALAVAEGPELDEALQSAFVARLRTGDDVGAIDALSSLAHHRMGDGDAFERLARHQARAKDVEGAIESGLHALGIFRNRRPDRARHLAEWLVTLAPDRDDLLALHADTLSLEGFGRAATALLAIAALESTSVEERRTRLSAAAERAEQERRSDLAADLLARAFDDDPGLEILHEPLAAVSAAGNTFEAHAVLLESIAVESSHDRASRFLAAAEAFSRIPRQRRHAFELATHSLLEDPELHGAHALLRELAESEAELEEAYRRAAERDRDRPRDELRKRLEAGDEDGIAAGLELSGLAALAGDFAESCDAALAVLELDSRHPLALARAERAARRLREPARMERAFDAGLRASPGTRERTRLLVHLAVLASARGDELTAVNRALEAIRVDPSSAEAYVLLTRRLELIPNEGLGGVVDRARASLGDSAMLLRRAIDVATARGLDKLALRLREARAHMSDLAGDALRARLALAAFSHDPAAPRAAIREALEVPDVIEEALDELLAAVERLLELDPKNAARLALAAVDRHGEGSFVPLAHRAAVEAGDPAWIVAALERTAAWSHGPAKAKALVDLASTHRARGSQVGEHRALLRLLSVSPRDPEALTRLIALYASTGEDARLEAVLELAIDSADDPIARAARLVQLARARFDRKGDAAGAIAALKALLDETSREGALPLEALPFAGEILPLFEAAAFELSDESAVHAFYDALEAASMGKHSQKGLVTRRARLLEKMGRYESALTHYGRAFAMEPAEGGSLDAIVRLGDALGDERAVVDAWLLLASRTEDADARVRITCDAADKLEETGDVTRACDVVLDLYRATNRLDLLPRLFDLARRAGVEKRDEVADFVVKKLEDRIDGSWDFSDQLRCLTRMVDAELLRERPDAASAAAHRASELSKTEEDAHQGDLAALHAKLAEYFDARLENDPARRHAARALEHAPDHAAARAILDRLGPPPEASRVPPPSVLPAPRRPPSLELPAQDALGPRMEVGQSRELMQALLADPAQPAIWLVLSEAEDDGSGVRDVAAAVRAAFEHETPPVERPFDSPCPIGLPLLEDHEALVDALLRTLERRVLPLLPTRVSDLGADPARPVSLDDPRPSAVVFRRLLDVTGVELTLHLSASLEASGRVATSPIAIVLAEHAERDPATLPFQLARLVALSLPGSLLVGSRASVEELETLLESIAMAFGGRTSGPDARADVVALASRLRRELPRDVQDEIANWLVEAPLPPASELAHMVHRRAAAIALLHTGTLYAAITTLFREDAALAVQPPRGLESLYSACKASPTLVEVLKLALDPAFTAMYREHGASR